MTLPLNDSAAIAAALRGSVLAGLPVEEDVGGVFVIDEIDPGEILPSWRAARALVQVTGRWPVAIGPEEVYGDPAPEELADLRQAAVGGDPWSVFQYEDEPPRYDPESDVAREDMRWFTPDEVQLALLPTTSQWLAPAWLRYHGAGDPIRWQALAGALHEWEQSCGAELVAWWATMLQFVVGRPPAQGDQAWEVAGQLRAVGGSLQIERPELARIVARSGTWFLHDRP